MFHESRLLSKGRDKRVTWYGNRAIFAWQLFCRMWLVAVIRLLRYWRVSADSLCLSKKPPIFPVYAFIYSEFSVSHFWQCRHLQRIAPSQDWTFTNFQTLSPRGILKKPLNLLRQELLFSTTHILFCFFFQSFFWGKNRNEMLIMSLKNKEIGTSCKKHLRTTIFSAVMPWADPFIFPFIFLDSGLVVFPCLWCWKVILTF